MVAIEYNSHREALAERIRALRIKRGYSIRNFSLMIGISKTRDFARVRCGIGRPPGKMSVADWALRQLKGSFLEEFELLAQDAADAVETCLNQGVDEGVRRTS